MKTAGQYLDRDRNREFFTRARLRAGRTVNPNDLDDAGLPKTQFTDLDSAREAGDVETRADRRAAAMDRFGRSSNPRGLIGGEYAAPAYRGGKPRKRIAGVTREQAEATMDVWRNSNNQAFAEMNRRKRMAAQVVGPQAKPGQAPAKADNLVAGANLFGPEPKMKLQKSEPSTRDIPKAELEELYQQGRKTAESYQSRRKAS